MNWKVIPLTKPVLAFISLDFQCVAYEIERVDLRDCCKFTYLGIIYFIILGLIGLRLPTTYTLYVLFALIPFAFLCLLKYNKFWLVATMGVIVVTSAIIQICQTANKWPNHPVGQKVLLTLHLIVVVYSFASGIPLVTHELSCRLLDPVPDNLDWHHYIHLYGPATSTFSNVINAISSHIVVTITLLAWIGFWVIQLQGGLLRQLDSSGILRRSSME